MPINLEFEKGSLAVFRVSGTLGRVEFERAQSQCEAKIRELGRVKILVLMDNFAGWEKTEGWEDMSFADRNDEFIDKLAIVGDAEWRDLAYAFTAKGLRPVPIEYFDANQETAARRWLETA